MDASGDVSARRTRLLPTVTWYSLIVMPSIVAPEKMAMFRIGPPTPQPTSSAFTPGFIPSLEQRWYSARLIDSRNVSPWYRGAKWNDWHQPYS